MKTIKLTKGFSCIIDDEDYDKLAKELFGKFYNPGVLNSEPDSDTI